MRGWTVSAGLCCGGLALGVVSVVFSHPQLGMGVWRDAGGVQVVLLAAAGLCLLGVAGATACRHPFPSHPAAWVLLALAGWSVLGAPFAEYPATALLGPPQTMYGAVWFAAQCAFLVAALIVAQHRRLFGFLAVEALALATVLAWFNLRNVPWLTPDWLRAALPRATMHGFNEYLGHLALGLLALAAALPRPRSRWPRAFPLLLALAGVVLLVLSGNRTAVGAALVGAMLMLCQHRWPVFGRYHLRIGRAVWLLVTPAIATYLLLRFGSADWLPPSLVSRQILLRVLEPDLWAPPWSLLLGHGWGHYQFTLLAQLPLSGISLTQPDWIDYARDEFHSHHALAEALFAAGLPGAVLVAAIPVAIAAGARPALRPVALALAFALMLLDSFWFQLPETMVPLALAVAATARRKGKPSPALLALPLAGLGAAMIALSVWQAHASQAMDGFRTCLKRGGARCDLVIPADPRQSQAGLAMLIGETLRDLQRRDWPARGVDRFGAVVADASTLCSRSCSPSLAMVLMNTHLMLAYVPKASGVFSAAQWRAVAVQMARRAPLRTDMLAPYLNWLLLAGGDGSVREMLADLPAASRQTPVGLWFSGLVQLDAPDEGDRRDGIAMMRLALSRGLERHMTVDPSIKAALEAAP